MRILPCTLITTILPSLDAVDAGADQARPRRVVTHDSPAGAVMLLGLAVQLQHKQQAADQQPSV